MIHSCVLFQTEANDILEDTNGDNLGGDDTIVNFPVYDALTPAQDDIDSGFGDEGEQRAEEEQILGTPGTEAAGPNSSAAAH